MNRGGNVFVAAGTGDFSKSYANEAGHFNGFLRNFGLEFEPSSNSISDTITINSGHAVFNNVGSLYSNNGNSIRKTSNNSSKSMILDTYSKDGREHGIYAIYDGTVK